MTTEIVEPKAAGNNGQYRGDDDAPPQDDEAHYEFAEASEMPAHCPVTGQPWEDDDYHGKHIEEATILARLFEERFGDEFLYDRNREGWYRFNRETHMFDWIKPYGLNDPAGTFFTQWFETKAEKYGEMIFGESSESNPAKQMNEAHRAVNRLRKIARSRRPITDIHELCKSKTAMQNSEWNADDWLIALPNGHAFDFSTGETRALTQQDRCTKASTIFPTAGDMPLFRKFMGEITRGDKELQTFLLRWMGYCLTGNTAMQKFLAIVGPGGNGKGALCALLAWLLADFAGRPQDGIFTIKTGGRGHDQAIATLLDKRALFLHDVAGNFDEQMLKSWVGGDDITGEWKYGDQITETPKGKLTITGQQLPGLQNIDQGIRRRLLYVRFNFTPEKVNENLVDEIMTAEGPAIMHRVLIEGHKYYKALHARDANPLKIPSSITEQTKEFLDAGDEFSDWFEDHIIVDYEGTTEGAFVSTDDMAKSVARYFKLLGKNRPPSSKRLKEKIDNKIDEDNLRYVKYGRQWVNGKRRRGYSGMYLAPTRQEKADAGVDDYDDEYRAWSP